MNLFPVSDELKLPIDEQRRLLLNKKPEDFEKVESLYPDNQ